MKKTVALLLTVLLLAGLAALTSAAAFAEAYSPDGSVIFEKDGLRVTTAGLAMDPTSADEDPILWIDVENSGAEDAFLGVHDGAVNGVTCDVWIIDFYTEDGEYYGGDYEYDVTVPAGSSHRYALGFMKLPGLSLLPLEEIALRFTLAESQYAWPSFATDPVVIACAERTARPDIAALGTVVLDNDELTVALGPQDYEDWIGPVVTLYLDNKTDRYLALTADSAEADGNPCEEVYFSAYAAPGRRAAAAVSFGPGIRELKSFETLTLSFALARTDAWDAVWQLEGEALDPVTLQYPPQHWGEYENRGLKLEIKPKYNDLVTVETPAEGALFTVSETASLEAGKHEGAGWLFSIEAVDQARLRELLGQDMSGVYAFAKDEDGQYYLCWHPTDVRYERETAEEMARDQAQWTMLCEWVESAIWNFQEQNGLDFVSYGNSEVDMLIARAAWGGGKATLSTTEFGPVDAGLVDGSDWAEAALQSGFSVLEGEEAPDGEYVVLAFPEEDMRLDFFTAPGDYVRLVHDGRETLYQALWSDDAMPVSAIMRNWYHAAAEKAGMK